MNKVDFTTNNVIDQRDVLDKGYVKFIDYMGDSYKVLRSARISTGGVACKGEKQDKGLLRYLYKNNHSSPYEQVSLSFDIKAPHFVITQFLRHRTAKINQFSLRYSPAIDDVYFPNSWRKQGEKNHQGSGDLFSYHENVRFNTWIDEAYSKNLATYDMLIENGVSREQARTVIPMGNYSLLTFTIDLRNLFHFLELRLHEHAQQEIRVYAEAIHDMLKDREEFKWMFDIFNEFNELKTLYQNAINKFSDTEKLKKMLSDFISEAEQH